MSRVRKTILLVKRLVFFSPVAICILFASSYLSEFCHVPDLYHSGELCFGMGILILISGTYKLIFKCTPTDRKTSDWGLVKDVPTDPVKRVLCGASISAFVAALCLLLHFLGCTKCECRNRFVVGESVDEILQKGALKEQGIDWNTLFPTKTKEE